MQRLFIALPTLVALATGAKVCPDELINEAMGQMNDPSCIQDMKQCLSRGTCYDAGISEARVCECFVQVGLPVAGRDIVDYKCKATISSPTTILDDWTHCTHLKTDL
jgi:hypothetical protein